MNSDLGLSPQITRIKPIWMQVGSAVLFFVFIKLLLSYIVLSSVAKVTIEAEFDHADSVRIYYSATHHFNEKLSKQSQVFASGKKEKRDIHLGDRVARRMRVDLGAQPGSVKLYSMEFHSHFGKTVHLQPGQIAEQFTPQSDTAVFTLMDDYLLVTSVSNDPYMTSKGELRYRNIFISIVLPLVFSYAFFLFISNFSWQAFPAIRDLQHKASSLGTNIGSLDGIRGLAALMVLAEHTGVLSGIGALGVRLFFALSGFLLATPFIQEPSRAVSYRYMSTFIFRRLKRILPMYYTFITITMLFFNKGPQAFRHYLFLQGDGHLWTIAQEMFFYLMLPIVVIAIFVLCKGKKIFSIVLLMAILLLSHRFLTIDVIYFYGYGVHLYALTDIFLSGVFFAYIFHWLDQNQGFRPSDSRIFRRLCSFMGLLLIVALVLLSAQLFERWRFFNALSYSSTVGFFSGAFIFLTVLAKQSLLEKIMSSYILRAIGIVGFSFYLLHPLLLSLYKETVPAHYLSGNMTKFIVVGITSYLFATITYTYVERPFLNKEK